MQCDLACGVGYCTLLFRCVFCAICVASVWECETEAPTGRSPTGGVLSPELQLRKLYYFQT